MPDLNKIKKRGGKLYLIFSDLDGTLLDTNYKYKEAVPALRVLKQKDIPVIFCSGKTIDEQLVFQDKMGLKYPFIAEDGSVIYIPKGHFKERKGKLMDGYEVILLGVKYKEIKKEINKLSKKYYIRAYCNMTAKEIGKQMGLDLKSAKLAKKRRYSETIIKADKKALQKLKKKFNVVCGGKGIHIFGKKANKGKTVKILTRIYKEQGQVVSIGIGNSYNDEAMLRAVDIAALVKNPDGSWAELKINGIYKAHETGPRGWVEVVKKFVLGE